MQILMCVPNISEGRKPETVTAVVDTIRAVQGVRLLDHSSDPDHNRSVIAFLGAPEAVLEAACQMSRRALELIDMRHHQGAHPRQGAVDVVPFIPLMGLDTAAAVEISMRYGLFMGQQGVPLYYYEDSARRLEWRSLAAIRKGQYEALAEKSRDTAWAPDEGPHSFNARAGATVTGARFALVAFNVNLRTTDVTIAQRIAKAVRHINGGYRYVRAIGLALEEEGLVQVSMNLTNFEKTPIPRVLETIRSEAVRHGVAVVGTEFVGPVPLMAIEEVLKHYLQAHDFHIDQIIEKALL